MVTLHSRKLSTILPSCTTRSVSCVSLGWSFPFIAAMLDAFAGFSRQVPHNTSSTEFRLLLPLCRHLPVKMKVPCFTARLGVGPVEVKANIAQLPCATPLNAFRRNYLHTRLFFFLLRIRQPNKASPFHAYDRRRYVHAFPDQFKDFAIYAVSPGVSASYASVPSVLTSQGPSCREHKKSPSTGCGWALLKAFREKAVPLTAAGTLSRSSLNSTFRPHG